MRNTEMLCELGAVRRADTAPWLYSILHWAGFTRPEPELTRLSGFLLVVLSATLFKLAFFSIC
jgi:hypothetical protein